MERTYRFSSMITYYELFFKNPTYLDALDHGLMIFLQELFKL